MGYGSFVRVGGRMVSFGSFYLIRLFFVFFDIIGLVVIWCLEFVVGVISFLFEKLIRRW